MPKGLTRRLDERTLTLLQKVPLAAVVPVSLAIIVAVGAVIPAAFNLDRWLTGLYAVLGAVLGWLPLVAVMHRERILREHRLLLLRSGYAEGIGRLSFREFEHLLAAWYEAKGYEATVQGGSGDQGVDLIATKRGERIAIQCKHWRTKEGGSPQVREFRGSVMDPRTKLVLVCSGTISDAAIREAKSKDVELVDGAELLRRLNEAITGLAPNCPQCGGEMAPKDGRRGMFWSCRNYPECKGAHDWEGPGSS